MQTSDHNFNNINGISNISKSFGLNDKKYDNTSQGLQLIMIFLDFIIPPQYFIDCDIFLNLLWMLHPCLNFTTLYSMIFVRQFFTFRALRETRLREFISGILMVVSLTVGCIFGSIILVVCGMLYLYPSQFSSPSNVTTECLTESTVSKRMFFSHRHCLRFILQLSLTLLVSETLALSYSFVTGRHTQSTSISGDCLSF